MTLGSNAQAGSPMPVLFVGHGSPMNAIEENVFSRAWVRVGEAFPRPKVILCVSAHWKTDGVQVTAMEQPRTIHDFYGFPRALYQRQYPAPGSPDLARQVQALAPGVRVGLDQEWGLDHGTWSVLSRLIPGADVPIVQLSLDRRSHPAAHYALARALAPLRDQGVLVIGSGNMVHNLGMLAMQDEGYDWAIEFDETLRGLILSGDHDALTHYERLGDQVKLAIPTNEHYLPLLYALALQREGDGVRFFADEVTMGSISMRSVWIG